MATGFTATSDGRILAPDGTPWRGYGVGVWDIQGSPVNVIDGGAALAQQMRALMPGLNLVRIADYLSYTFHTPQQLAPFINDMTNAGVAVVIEDHNDQHTVLTGSALQAETNWYASMASYYKDNPLVMFQSMNEPGTTGESAQILAEYNAIRGTGNNNLFFVEAGYGAGGSPNFDDPSIFAKMSNIAFDYHAYSYSHSTLQSVSTIDGIIDNVVHNMQTIKSASGTIPVASLEGGNSVDGSTIDASGANEVQAAYTDPNLQGFAAWIWNVNNHTSTADNMTNPGGASLNSYGQLVASYIAAGTGPTGGGTPPPPPPPPPPSASPDNTVILASQAGASIVDAGGNTWTIASGVVQENGQPAGYSANVTELAWESGVIWQENSSSLWWSWNGSGWAGGNGISISPVPGTAPPVVNGVMTLSTSDTNVTVSASNITIQATSGDHMLFLNGSNDVVKLTGGKEQVTDNSGHNTIVLPAAAHGTDDLFGNVFTNGDTLDLRPALAATRWTGSTSSIGKFVHVSMNGSDAIVSVSSRSGGSATMIADLHGVGSTNLQGLLAHSIT